MLRIIGGKYKRRLLKVPSSEITRPTMNKVREAVFSSLSFDIADSIFLDLFGGSGAVGLEALSRGSTQVYINELDKNTFKILSENVKNIDIDHKVILTKGDYKEILNVYKNQKIVFDIVYLDPPYKMQITKEIFEFLIKYNMVNKDSILISETNYEPEELNDYESKIYKYGSKYVCKYIRKED